MTCRLAILLASLPVLALARNPSPAGTPPQAPATTNTTDALDQAAAESNKPADSNKAADPGKQTDTNKTADPNKPAAAKPADGAKPQVEKLGEGKYRIGGVTLDAKTREIRFPTKVNMDNGLQEYIVCKGPQGKLHEALLVTEINATHLSLAFTLLRYAPSPELFGLRDESGHPTGLYPNVPATVKAGARIAVDVEWVADGKTHRLPINDWLQLSVKQEGMKSGPWLYTGSDFYEGKFIPEMSGDLAAIMVDQGCLINYPGSDNVDSGSQVWYAYPKRVPAVGTPVTVIITPYSNTRPLPKP